MPIITLVARLKGVDRRQGDALQLKAEGTHLALCGLLPRPDTNVPHPENRRCNHVFAGQTCLTALANPQGKLEDRLARWPLMAQDCIEADENALTHEFLSLLLGVRRAGVTTAQQTGANSLYAAPEAEFERPLGTERCLLENEARQMRYHFDFVRKGQ